MTTYTFDEADNTGLSTISGWTRESSEERFQANGAGSLERNAVTGTAHWYREGSSASGNQKASAQWNVAASGAPFLCLFGSWNGSAFTGYALRSHSATTFRLFRVVTGTQSLLQTYTVTSSTAEEFSLEATVNGSQVDLVVRDSGENQISTTFSDTDANRQTSGYNGLYDTGTTALTTGFLTVNTNLQDVGGGSSESLLTLLGVG